MTREEKISAIEEILDNLSPESFVECYNRFCGDDDCVIYPMDELDERLSDWTASDILRYCSEIDTWNDWFVLGDTNESSDSPTDLISEDTEDIAQYCVDEDDDLRREEIRAILNQSESDLEEDLTALIAVLPDSELIDLWDAYAHENGDPKSIYRLSRANAVLESLTAWELVRSLHLVGNHVDLGEEFVIVTTQPDGARIISTTDNLEAYRDPAKLVPYIMTDRDRAEAYLAAHS